MRSTEFITEETEDVKSSILKKIMTSSLLKLEALFDNNKFDLRIIGGAVRDLMSGKQPKDIDLASDATPDEMISMFDEAGIRFIPTGVEHGTITVLLDDTPYEITTLRADVETTGRHATVEFIRNWKEDAQRRDLTYNAMSLDFDGTLYDYFDGMDDLQKSQSKFVGDPEQRIKEDYLRILRYFRFQGRISNPVWDTNTINAIRSNAKGLFKISAERVWMEMQKILTSPNVVEVLTWMGKTGVTEHIGLSVVDTPKVHDNPIAALAAITNDRNLASHWKFSNNENALFNYLLTHKNTVLDQAKAEELITDGDNSEHVQALAAMQGVTIKPFDQTEFPVRGQDLINIGMPAGPEIGQTLEKLRQAWKAAKYQPTKDELLKTII